MIRARFAPLGLLIALGLSACQNKTEPAPAPSATAPAATAAPTASDIPTSVDYEQKAQDEINPQNMEQELDKLEAAIGK